MKEELGDEWLPPRALPPRRERAAHRHRAPARALRDRRLLGGPPSPDGVGQGQREGNGMSVAEIFETMEYGPAPEAAAPALAWLDAHDRAFGHFIGGAFVPGSGHFDSVNPATGEAPGPHRAGDAGARSTPPWRRPARRSRPGARSRPRPGPLSLRHRAPGAEALAPARRARDARQRQADPRDARHRHAAGRPPLLPPRRLGAARGARVARLRAGRRRRARSSRGTSRC